MSGICDMSFAKFPVSSLILTIVSKVASRFEALAATSNNMRYVLFAQLFKYDAHTTLKMSRFKACFQSRIEVYTHKHFIYHYTYFFSNWRQNTPSALTHAHVRLKQSFYSTPLFSKPFKIFFQNLFHRSWVKWFLFPPPTPEAESVHSALVSAVSKAKMSDLTESLAPTTIQKALPTEWNICWLKDFPLTVNLLYDNAPVKLFKLWNFHQVLRKASKCCSLNLACLVCYWIIA